MATPGVQTAVNHGWECINGDDKVLVLTQRLKFLRDKLYNMYIKTVKTGATYGEGYGRSEEWLTLEDEIDDVKYLIELYEGK